MKKTSRRGFLKSGAATAGSIALLSSLPRPAFAKSLARTTGIQLYTVNKELGEDLPGTLAKISAIGYRRVESAGLAGKSATEFRKALDDAGLTCPSSHLFPVPGQTREQFFDVAKTLGSEYVVSSVIFNMEGLKSIDDYIRAIKALTEDDYKKMAGQLNDLATKAKASGLKFAYHNHNMEFHKLASGKTAYETMMAETDPELVKIELDCGWSDLGGAPPLEIFKKYKGRVKMLHIKDFVAVGHPVTELNIKEMPESTELGKGHIDYRRILAAAPAAGVEQIFVEQEPPFVKFTALEAAKADYDYLQSIA